MTQSKELRTLTIKSFHMNDVKFSDKTCMDNGILYIKESIEGLSEHDPYIKEVKVQIIKKNERDRFVNSIMDFIPIATKVLGKIGEGITHTLTGTLVMLTGVDEDGIQVAEFGSSEGILENQIVSNMAGTPSDEDIIIHVDAILKSGMGTNREAIIHVHKMCDFFIQEIREKLKKVNGRKCDERHDFTDKTHPNRKKVLIVKQVAGQGAMYDTWTLPKEPGGVEGGVSIIDMFNVPIILSPNQYRDGALRAMH
ncbi:proline reductase cluster protein PrdD [Anaeromicrobium sediminis]|uniref:Proline reductase cluster protein PrdD n=1 Tax=Anaeromicrobium sediminis TaxID=1478221 RepID=A0A267MI85_9FIRM|nr:proline reductase cluster protein PrdD [Anaeromicrobium sediminis]